MKQEKLTKFVKTEDADQKWYLVDAKDQTLGRLASKIAMILEVKQKLFLLLIQIPVILLL